LNHGIIYDFGSSEDFCPSEFIEKNLIPYLSKPKDGCTLIQTVISHPHLDHISNIECLQKSSFNSALHTCPHHKNSTEILEAIDWSRIQNPKGNEEKVKIYKELYENRNLPLQTARFDSDQSIPNLEYGIFYLRPPEVAKLFPNNDQEYANGISLLLYYKHGRHSILIPGDVNPEVLSKIIAEEVGLEKRYTVCSKIETLKNPNWSLKTSDQPSLSELLKNGLTILVAPHHGLESGFSKELFAAIKNNKPEIVAISEKRHTGENDGSVHKNYQSVDGASGLIAHIDGIPEERLSISTVGGHHMLFVFPGVNGSPEIYLEKDPCLLLDKMN
jgi:hypothetical protein